MRQYEDTERQLPEYGKVFTEHPKFGHYKTGIEWVCVVTGENQSKYFALSNLRELFITRMEFTCAEPPPIHIYPMPAMYPRDVFLAAANYMLEMKRREIASAVASGQLPEAEAA